MVNTELEPKPPAEIDFVVSGFGPWGEGTPWPPVPINTAWLITAALPRVLFRHGKPNIRIVTYPKPVYGAYTSVRKLVPQMWDGKKDVLQGYIDPDKPGDDVYNVFGMLHMGMLDQPGEAYRLERNGFKEGYHWPGQDGKEPTEADMNGDGAWDKLPDILSTDLDVDSIFDEVQARVQKPNLKVSNDIIRFMCSYMYWTSLAEVELRKEKRRLLFMHTPIEHESEDIEHGVELVKAIIEAAVDQLESPSKKNEDL